MAREILFDTDTFSNLKGKPSLHESLLNSNDDYYMCDAQLQEVFRNLDRTPAHIREQVVTIISILDLQIVDPDTYSWGRDSWGQMPWGGRSGEFYDELQEEHREPENKSHADARGAEAALSNGMTFVTKDGNLKRPVKAVASDQLLPEKEFVSQLD